MTAKQILARVLNDMRRFEYYRFVAQDETEGTGDYGYHWPEETLPEEDFKKLKFLCRKEFNANTR